MNGSEAASGYNSDSAVQYDRSRGGSGLRGAAGVQEAQGMEGLTLHPKSLVALQELQNEVGALLEFRDLVIETFPNLRNKMAAGPVPPPSSIPLPAASRRDWEAGTRVRRKLLREAELLEGPLSRSRSNSHSKLGSGVQDSGFSTDAASSASTSSKEASKETTPAAYDELWSLLDVIHRKGSRLRDEARHLQAAWEGEGEDEAAAFSRHLQQASPDDVQVLRRERDGLLDRVVEMEATNLASDARAYDLQARVETLLEAKRDLQRELDVALMEKTELNIRLERLLRDSGSSTGSRGGILRHQERFRPLSPTPPTADRSTGPQEAALGRLDSVLGSPSGAQRFKPPDRRKMAAILMETSPVELQRHLLAATAQNQALSSRLELTREENEDLRFQLEERNIELEGTKARVRVLEGRNAAQDSNTLHGGHESLKNLSPLPITVKQPSPYSSSTESAHDNADQGAPVSPRRRPSRIPKPGSGRPSSATPSKAARSPNRSLSRDSVVGASSIPIARAATKSYTNGSPMPKPKRDSLTMRVRNHDSLSRVRDSSVTSKGRTTHPHVTDTGKLVPPSSWRLQTPSTLSTLSSPSISASSSVSTTSQGALIRQYLSRHRVPPRLDNTPLRNNNLLLEQPSPIWDLAYRSPRLEIKNKHSGNYFDSINNGNVLDLDSANVGLGGEDLAYCDSLIISPLSSDP